MGTLDIKCSLFLEAIKLILISRTYRPMLVAKTTRIKNVADTFSEEACKEENTT